jgi:hypothetical protein
MSGSITFNPYATTSPANSFLLQTQGYVQGLALDDPSARMWLAGGTLATTETVTMWGGVPIEEIVNNAGAGGEGLGPVVKRSVSQATVTGFSVFNQASSMVITPGNTVPLAGTGNFVAFYRLGTNQRIAIKVDPALVATLSSTSSVAGLALYWDVTNYRVTLTTTGGNWALPTSVRLLSVNTNSKIVSYDSGTGVASWTTGDAAILLV